MGEIYRPAASSVMCTSLAGLQSDCFIEGVWLGLADSLIAGQV